MPCLTLRENTERPITVTHGTNRIIGVDPETDRRRLATGPAWRWPMGQLPELWDGKAAERIVDVLLEGRA